MTLDIGSDRFFIGDRCARNHQIGIDFKVFYLCITQYPDGHCLLPVGDNNRRYGFPEVGMR